jgi:uncharacterized protein (DUF433 family)
VKSILAGGIDKVADLRQEPVDRLLDQPTTSVQTPAMVQDWQSRISIVPGVHGGQPVIRGMRLAVKDVFEYLAGGMSVDDLLSDFPELTREDVEACFAYAAAHSDRPQQVA